ncbi:hypothetical protein Tco_0874262 [Tanacetum coccineum]|uniref:Uncharacterized protein n=1 Tax=Tanacetum coccineum TaxID=301880 RepID=A0ABQ5BP93_9ASTR
MKSSRKSTDLTANTPLYSRPIRRIQDFDESEDHCLTLKNTPLIRHIEEVRYAVSRRSYTPYPYQLQIGRNQGKKNLYGDKCRRECTNKMNESFSQALVAQDGLGSYGTRAIWF